MGTSMSHAGGIAGVPPKEHTVVKDTALTVSEIRNMVRDIVQDPSGEANETFCRQVTASVMEEIDQRQDDRQKKFIHETGPVIELQLPAEPTKEMSELREQVVQLSKRVADGEAERLELKRNRTALEKKLRKSEKSKKKKEEHGGRGSDDGYRGRKDRKAEGQHSLYRTKSRGGGCSTVVTWLKYFALRRR
ncbi:hypothetical protein LZ30DRAFT_243892 [Colletotrichum cereale]|nr:hypothetical protein LZ30DRAFT_243892 [Colletotrichum cereale]